LQLRPINVPAIRHIQALVAEHFNDPSAEGPLLRSRPSAWLDGDEGGVGIGGGGQAFSCVSERLMSKAEDSQDVLMMTYRY
jgi:hypothetical protein